MEIRETVIKEQKVTINLDSKDEVKLFKYILAHAINKITEVEEHFGVQGYGKALEMAIDLQNSLSFES